MGEQEKVAELRSLFLVHSNPEKAIEMERYMKNNFPFLGLQAPIRRTIQKQWINSNKSLTIDQNCIYISCLSRSTLLGNII